MLEIVHCCERLSDCVEVRMRNDDVMPAEDVAKEQDIE